MKSGTSAGESAHLLVQRICPVCSSGESVSYARKGDLSLVKCRICSLVYASPVPAAFASGQYYDESAAGYYLSPAKLESDYAPVRFERELKVFRTYCRGGEVLDVGCGSGGFLYQLIHRFGTAYHVLGTDASGPALDHAQSRGLAVVRGDFLEQDFGSRRFDAITFWAVLEHLDNPQAFLTRASCLLRDNGLCFVLVPNMRSLAARILGLRYRYVYPQHLNYFTRSTLTRLVNVRFRIAATFSTHFNPIILWQDWRSGGKEIPDRERGELLKKTTAFKQRPILRPIKPLYRLSERLLGALDLADNLLFVLRKR